MDMSRRGFLFSAASALACAWCSGANKNVDSGPATVQPLLGDPTAPLGSTTAPTPVIVDSEVYARRMPLYKDLVNYFREKCEDETPTLWRGRKMVFSSSDGTANIVIERGETTQTGSDVYVTVDVTHTRERNIFGILREMAQGEREELPSWFSPKDPILVRFHFDRPVPVLERRPSSRKGLDSFSRTTTPSAILG